MLKRKSINKYVITIGMLMIPKTCAYVWTVFIGYVSMKKNIKTN